MIAMESLLEQARLLNNAALQQSPREALRLYSQALAILLRTADANDAFQVDVSDTRVVPTTLCKAQPAKCNPLILVPPGLPVSVLAAAILYNYSTQSRSLDPAKAQALLNLAHASIIKDHLPIGSLGWQVLGCILRKMVRDEPQMALQLDEWQRLQVQFDVQQCMQYATAQAA